jgi:ketosteroid isomerase-like protein
MPGKGPLRQSAVMTDNSNPASDPKVDAVRDLYAAIFRNDMDGVMAHLAEDVDWAAEAAGNAVPWYGSYLGSAEVPRFFKELMSSIDIEDFTPVSFTSNDTDVVAVIRWAFTVKSTGKRAAMYMQHWWRFAGGKIVFFRGSEDSGQTIAAFS